MNRSYYLRFSPLLLCSAFLFYLACGVSAPVKTLELPPSIGQSQHAIVNGQKNLAYPAAGTMMGEVGGQRQSFCSGTLIAPRVVLTAAHCIEAFDQQQLKQAKLVWRMDIPTSTGTYRSVYSEIDRTESKMHPQYKKGQGTNIVHDVGVIVLKTAVFEVTPLPFNEKIMDATWKGNKILFMGYGLLDGVRQTPAKDKWSTIMPVTEIAQYRGSPKPNTFGYEGKNTSVCRGDSGGPAFYKINGKMTVIGVTSHGTDPRCRGTSFSFRTDPYVAWIKSFITKFSSCKAAADCGACRSCNSGVCDYSTKVQPSAKLCGVCKTDAECGAGNACIKIGTGSRCVQKCDAKGCCPTGYFCGGTAGKKHCYPEAMACPPAKCKGHSDCSAKEVCVAGFCEQKLPAPTKELCQPCTKLSECSKGGFCQTPDGRGGRCLQACDADGLCPKDFLCKELFAGNKLCIPKDNICRAACGQDSHCRGGLKCVSGVCKRPGGSLAGEPCAKDLPCKSGLECLETPTGGRCYQTCGSPEGSAGAPCKKGNVCDAGLNCLAFPGVPPVCVQYCNNGKKCTLGGSCFNLPVGGLALCACQNDGQCGSGGKCNTIAFGFGACSKAQSAGCPAGQECAKQPAGKGACVRKGATGNQGLGQPCNQFSRCQAGLTCAPVLNVCVEECTQSNKCSKGGQCRSLPIPGVNLKFCLCGANDGTCPSKTKCRTFFQGVGICEADTSSGCSSHDQCPAQYICQGGKCVPGQRPKPEPQPEPKPEPKPEPVVDSGTPGEGTGTQPDAGPGQDTAVSKPDTPATKDTTGGTKADEGTTVPEPPAKSACGCEATPGQATFGPVLIAIWFILMPLVFRRRRQV